MSEKAQPPVQGACSHLQNCPMFAAFASESAGRIFKKLYCEGNYRNCMRYQRSEQGMSVPANLLPNGSELRA